MGFLESSKQRMRLARQRRQLEAEPRPHGLAELARGYLALGDPATAEEVLAFAERRFKDSEAVKRVRATLRGGDLDTRLQRAKEAVKSRPSVAAWLELADAYRALERDDQYGATLREALERFQQDSTVLTQLGELRYRRFLSSLATSDGKAALDLYERAIAGDADNLKARYQHAELLFRIGAVQTARMQLTKLLAMSPAHGRAARLAAAIDESASRAAAGEPAAKDSNEAKDSQPREDLWSLFAQVEERMALADVAGVTSQGDRDPAGESPSATGPDPADEMERLFAVSGAMQVVFSEPSGEMHAMRCGPSLVESSRRLHDASLRAARGMELGTPTCLTIDADGGSLAIEMKRGASIALLLPREASLPAATIAARDALERLVGG